MLDINSSPIDSPLHYSDSVFFIGSCFSEHIANRSKENGMHVNADFGTFFHPFSIAKILSWSIKDIENLNHFQKEDVFLSWDLPSTFHAMNSSDFDRQLLALRNRLEQGLASSKYLFVTFGTSYFYRHIGMNTFVANCHKIPNSEFQKEIATIGEMYRVWDELLDVLLKKFPHIKLVFTVSPVRHTKDGLVENTLSKARLFELIHRLKEKYACHYFPAYELVIDVLRDYRFFSSDEVHPNDAAIDFVWQHFKTTFFSAEMRTTADELQRLRKLLHHKYLHPLAQKSIELKQNTLESYKQFKAENPNINWKSIE